MIKDAEVVKRDLEEMCEIQCSKDEIYDSLGADKSKLDSLCMELYGVKFDKVYRIHRARGKERIRRLLYQKAQENPIKMLQYIEGFQNESDKERQQENLDNFIEALNLSAREVWKEGDDSDMITE